MMFISIGLVVLFLLFAIKSPVNQANWQAQFQVLPNISMDGDLVTIKNVRDFRYSDDGEIAQVRYLDQDYKLSEFKQAWFGLSHFSANGLAHAFMSFEFSGDRFLAVSIEARLEKKQAYSPIKGLFRTYTKTIVLATEQDVIGLRSHIRGEPVYLYKLDVPELYTKPLFLNFLREAQVLTKQPTFYNTLIDNCMTGLLAQSDQFRNISSWLDYRIMLPGYSDEIAYDLGFIDNSESLENVRDKALVNPFLTRIGDGFSIGIRKN